jgi:1-acyl-sn-glycerol-3-phosphate acyltransferase
VGRRKKINSVLERLEAAVLQTMTGISSLSAADQQTDEFGCDLPFVQALEPVFNWLYTDYWRVQTVGVGHIPSAGRALIVANHSGTLPFDGSMVNIAVRKTHGQGRFVRFLVEDFVFHSPFMGVVMNRLGGVRACPENANRLLAREDVVAVFPEGVKGLGKLYEERYQLARFGRGGFVRVAAEMQVPVIPCAIVGAEEIYPILWKSDVLAKSFNVPYLPITPTFPWLGALGLIPLPSQWVIAFGPPIHVPSAIVSDPLKIHKWSLDIRAVIQQMVKEMLKVRRSVWEF